MDKDNFFIVGVGASAGGLDAIRDFFRNIPANNNMAFVVIQHLSPDYKSLMGELIAKFTDMEVQQITDGAKVEKGNIYVIPPKKNVKLKNHTLILEESIPHKLGINLPINLFFESLATEKGKYSAGVILSGTGSDGSKGIKKIKQEGGLILVQDPFESKFDGMPRSAISTGITDYISKTEDMGKILLSYTSHPFFQKENLEDNLEDMTKETLINKILGMVRQEKQIDFTYYKKKTIVRRLEKRLGMTKSQDFNKYIEYIYTNPDEIEKLYNELLIGVTEFFRDKEYFDFINNEIIPKIINSKETGDEVRVWVVGCATGEEAYSIAIMIKEYLRLTSSYLSLKLFATDIDQHSLDFASKGVFSKNSISEIPDNLVENYFVQNGDSYQVSKDIRESIVFANHNISNDPPFNNIDFISCRNLLIYFEIPLQQQVLRIFNFSLIDKGFLFLGKSESIGDEKDIFETYNQKYNVFQSKKSNAYKLNESLLRNSALAPRNIKNVNPVKPKSNRYLSKKEKLNDVLLKKHIPSCVIINKDEKILHVYGSAKDYFRDFSGEINFTVQNTFYEELAHSISLGVAKVLSSNERIMYKKVKFKKEDKTKEIDLKITPIILYESNEKFAEVDFINLRDVETLGKEVEITKEESNNYKVLQLENELQNAKEDLKTTLEELETSNEELQATNEELLASNEELQSTNEELQSVNEEILTVNAEYQMKNEELEKLNDDINNLLKSTQIGTIFLDTELMIRKFTPAATSEINLIKSDIGRPISDISHNLEYDSLESDSKEVLNNLKAKEIKIKNKNGDYFLLKILPFITNEKNVDGVVLTFIKVSDVIEAQKDAQVRQTMFNSVIENSPVGVCITDEKGYFIDVNKTYCKLYEYSREELIGKHFTIIAQDHQKKDLAKLHDRFIKNKEELEGHWDVVTKKNNKLNIKANAIYLEDSEKNPRKVTFVTNMTKEKSLENSLRIAKENAEKSNEYKSMFLANMTHELRTPMNGIIGTIDFLKDTFLDQEQQEFVDMLQNSSNYLLEIINNILDISKMEQNKLVIKVSKIDIIQLLYETIETISPKLKRKNLKLTFNKHGKFDYFILSDYIRIKQIFINLIGNSIKFTEEGEIKIEINEEIVEENKAEILFSVTDTGCGISEINKQYIFEAFNQGDITSTKKYQGTGLGLSLVKHIVDLLGGEIFFQSEQGSGTNFDVKIKFDIEKKDKNNNIDKESFKDIKALIVEDNEINAKMLEKILKMLNIQSELAVNGSEALTKYNENSFDLIFMDLQMPIMDGYDATKEIRKMENGDMHTPIIAVTAYTQQESRKKALDSGMDSFMNKPVSKEKIKNIIEKLMES